MSSPSFREEKLLWKKGYKYVIGVDEVGRGAFAGPVSAAAVIFECPTSLKLRGASEIDLILKMGINDSKLLKPAQRHKLSKLIQDGCLHYSIATVGVSKINEVGIGKATGIAFRKAVQDIIGKISPNVLISEYPNIFLLADGFHIKHIRKIGLKNQKAIIKGDRKSISIAAASIIAKVHRDRIMKRLSKKYLEYGFGRNKGYGTKYHREAIKKYGLTKIHRKSFNLSKFT